MLHKFLIATFATILNNYVTLFRPIDYRTVLTCLMLTIVLWPLIPGRFYPTDQAGVGNRIDRDYRVICLWLNCAIYLDASFIFAKEERRPQNPTSAVKCKFAHYNYSQL